MSVVKIREEKYYAKKVSKLGNEYTQKKVKRIRVNSYANL